ncbi:MAG: ADP-ribosylglycohydrolase family protein [Fibrobacteres bacterium]|nr:ADP-ribosylglycohydrolase family protein [Fibrobacterota bacterium]
MVIVRPPSRPERIAGGLWGLLVGDAVGVPYEFAPRQRIPALPKIDMDPPVEFMRSHVGIKPGTWSDDGSQSLCLAASLLERGGLDIHDLMDRMARWFRDGYLAVDRDVFDVGLQTRQAIGRFLSGKTADKSAASGEWSNGNGSLMRSLPLALWHRGSPEELVRDAFLQSSITHGHLRSGICCALYCLWARSVLEGGLHPWHAAIERFETLYPAGTPERTEYETNIHPRNPDPPKGSGYVVDSLLSAVWACQAGGYEAVIKAAISLGQDTDTTACIAGGIAGVREGLHAIPHRWMKRMRGKELALPILEAFLAYDQDPSSVPRNLSRG